MIDGMNRLLELDLTISNFTSLQNHLPGLCPRLLKQNLFLLQLQTAALLVAMVARSHASSRTALSQNGARISHFLVSVSLPGTL